MIASDAILTLTRTRVARLPQRLKRSFLGDYCYLEQRSQPIEAAQVGAFRMKGAFLHRYYCYMEDRWPAIVELVDGTGRTKKLMWSLQSQIASRFYNAAMEAIVINLQCSSLQRSSLDA